MCLEWGRGLRQCRKRSARNLLEAGDPHWAGDWTSLRTSCLWGGISMRRLKSSPWWSCWWWPGDSHRRWFPEKEWAVSDLAGGCRPATSLCAPEQKLDLCLWQKQLRRQIQRQRQGSDSGGGQRRRGKVGQDKGRPRRVGGFYHPLDSALTFSG